MTATIDTYRDLAGQRANLCLRVERHSNGSPRAYTIKDVTYGYLEDGSGNLFSARLPASATLSKFTEVSAKIHHVGFDGRVVLKNVRLRKSR